MVRRRLIVRGRVQGVGFRIAVARRAQVAGVAGFARNRGDGSVEVVLEGPPEGVELVAAFCAEGPRGARVDEVASTSEPPQGEPGFRVG